MSYSDFTLKKVKTELGLKTVENISLFEEIQTVDISNYLAQTLLRNVPLALAMNTEKARSELIIINVLLEIKEQVANQVSLFSGVEFTVDRNKGLNGFCDYIFSQSPEQLYIDAPVLTIVEAKNENIIAGLGQCIAEMYAAQLFNQQEQQVMPYIYGAVTSGDEWKFLKLSNDIAYIDQMSYYISDIKKIVAILIHILNSSNARIIV
jgi:hypothetical protein